MKADLYKIKGGWVVQGEKYLKVQPTVELACDSLLELGVVDEEIDVALIELHGNGHSRASFGIEGRFVFSDSAKFDELGRAS